MGHCPVIPKGSSCHAIWDKTIAYQKDHHTVIQNESLPCNTKSSLSCHAKWIISHTKWVIILSYQKGHHVMPNGTGPLHAKRIISHTKWVIILSYQKGYHVMPNGTGPLHTKRIITLSYKMSHYPVIPKGSLSCHAKWANTIACQKDH